MPRKTGGQKRRHVLNEIGCTEKGWAVDGPQNEFSNPERFSLMSAQVISTWMPIRVFCALEPNQTLDLAVGSPEHGL